MEKKYYLCNTCSKMTDDYYKEIGWIIIELTFMLITRGRNHNNNNTSNIVCYESGDNKGLHFCSLPCLTEWVGKLGEEK